MATAALNTTVHIPLPSVADFHLDTTSAQPPPAPRMVTVKLLKNYRPLKTLAEGGYEVVGYTRPAILKKNAAGMMETVQAEEFIAGELPPPPTPGTGFDTKLWADAVIKLPADEAKTVRKAGIGEYEIDD